jgi:hypothetical protein
VLGWAEEQALSSYHLTPEEIEQLRDWAVASLAEMEARGGRPIRVARGREKTVSAKEALEERKLERGAKFKPSRE